MTKIFSKIIQKKNELKIIGIVLTLATIIFLVISSLLFKQLMTIYQNQESIIVLDRYGKEILIRPNQKGYWARYLNEVPARIKKLLIQKEDKYFYYHPGFNLWSISQAALSQLGIGNRKASSTISQQLAKILLGKESNRNLKNKIIESFYTLSLEIFCSKEEILKMYVNSIYLGNQAQGLAEASQLYFNLPPDLLTDGQILQLLATLHSPTDANPAKIQNEKIAVYLAQTLNLKEQNLMTVSTAKVRENMKEHSRFEDTSFELTSLLKDWPKTNQVNLTIDKELTEKIREIIQRNIENLKTKNVNQSAAIVIKLPENEILSLIGSPDPLSLEQGSQINMLLEPRPIGSTIKPFIYLKAFEKGLRPYTLVQDKEYKYITALGFPLYPKNFDFKYRGEVNLHYALSNSLNVPAVKVLEYVGLDEFYNFMEKDLGFIPIQNWENYQLGIALGSLEMSLFNLAKYFTVFPNKGILKDLKIYQDAVSAPEKRIAEPQYVQLVNIILNDRKTSIEQFGLKSDLNLFQENYALKTGTSRDFRDSWIIGFTPDFLVAVWVGNSDNSPMDKVSGQLGAGRIWAQIMELLLNSPYNKKTPFDFSLVKGFPKDNNLEYGLANDNYEESQNALWQKTLILDPHDGDVFLLEENSHIFLKSNSNAQWFVNNIFLAEGKDVIFTPQNPGTYEIKAKSPNGFQETVMILVTT
jgi:penicillin-binding protein 1C